MRSTLAYALMVPVLLVAPLLASCATDPFVTGSVAKRHHKRSTVAYRSVSERSAQTAASTPSQSVATAPATAAPVATQAVESPAEVTSKEDPRWQWCEQRHLDHQAGKAPAGAQDLEQKLKDDRTCAAVYAQRANAPAPAEAMQPIDTGSIETAPSPGR